MAELITAVVEGAKPWVSVGIEGGEEFVQSLRKHLNEADFAVVCLTVDTRESRWIFYELGSLIGKGVKVCPYLIDQEMPRGELPLPLPGRQSRRANKDETFELLRQIKLKVVRRLSKRAEKKLKETFDQHWPKFDEIIQKGRLRTVEDALKFSRERVSDVISLSRNLKKYVGFLEKAMEQVVPKAVALYDSRRHELKTKSKKSDPAFVELIKQIQQLAWEDIEKVREHFNERHSVIGDVRKFLTDNYEPEDLKAFLMRVAKTLDDDSKGHQREEQLKKEVKIEIGRVFFKFQEEVAKCLLTSFKL